ncbi:MAG: hypothetical protein KGD61_08960 [Candidatus Lokiarchaeota archaeon]|nr:hypothetical protein [Candidatus Lokiarchaeota archaeon]
MTYNDQNTQPTNSRETFYKIGVERTKTNNFVNITIFKNYKKYVKEIILREAYKCFIPDSLEEEETIHIFITQRLISDLQKLPSIKHWETLIKKKTINYEFRIAEFDRLEKFLKRESTELYDSPFQFFFKFMRKNLQLIGENRDNFYDKLFEEYLIKTSKTLFNDDIVETLRIIIFLFYETKQYKIFLDYQNLFKDYVRKGVIKTNLSQKKFTENVQWIGKYLPIAPNYKINWKLLNLNLLLCHIRFNPLIQLKNIYKIINNLPFFLIPKYSRDSFGYDIFGYFLLPKCYYEDLVKFLRKLEDSKYVIQIDVYSYDKIQENTNLNYFRSFSNKKGLINTLNKQYEKKYEIQFQIEYGNEPFESKLSMLEWLIIDRVRYFSITGFGFEKRAKNLNLLKSDLINEIISQQALISELKKNLKHIYSSLGLKEKILNFIEKNEKFGFFYVKNILNEYLTVFTLFKKLLLDHGNVKTRYQLSEVLNNNFASKSIEDNIIFSNKNIKNDFVNEFIPLYLKSQPKFLELVEEFSKISKVFKSCYDLKIFNLNAIKTMVEDKKIIENIYKSKEEKLRNSYENYTNYNITNQIFNTILNKFIYHEPPIIQPLLISTINTPSNFLPVLIIKRNSETLEKLDHIKFLFPKIMIIEVSDIKSQDELFFIEIYSPNLKKEEKQLLYTVIFNLFRNNIISFKRYYWSGFVEAFTRKDFFDFECKAFYYSKDLFEQYFIFLKKTLGDLSDKIIEFPNKILENVWLKEKNVTDLIKQVEDRIRSENIDLNINNLHHTLEFSTELEENILNIDKFKRSQEEYFFKNYVKAIKILPSFKDFGLSPYSLYFYPTDINKIDFKLLLNNAFQSINYPAQIDNSNSFLIQYIYPYLNPGISPYLNWLTKSKKIVREYCLFTTKKFYQILHFNYNLSSEGWDLDPNRFKIYFQNILFNPDYKVQIPDLKEFNIGDLSSSNYFGPNSSEFKALSQIYRYKSLDVKSYLTRRYFKINKSITDLLKKGLINPFISLKNLDIIEEITIILPDVDKKHNESILKIFSFFNIGFIYHIEGEYYINGFEEVIKFENGIMIKLCFPDCQTDEFEKLFDLIFEYMEIDHYLILTDLVDGENLIKSTFNGLKFLETYRPLTNLIWNEKDKRWRNHKLFNEKFEPVYPDMFFGKNKYKL